MVPFSRTIQRAETHTSCIGQTGLGIDDTIEHFPKELLAHPNESTTCNLCCCSSTDFTCLCYCAVRVSAALYQVSNLQTSYMQPDCVLYFRPSLCNAQDNARP